MKNSGHIFMRLQKPELKYYLGHSKGTKSFKTKKNAVFKIIY